MTGAWLLANDLKQISDCTGGRICDAVRYCEPQYLKIASKKQHFTSICKIKKICLVPLSYRIFSPGRFI